MIICSALLDEVSSRDALAQSYTMLIAAVSVGMAAGSYAAGALVDYWDPPSIFGVVAVLLVCRSGMDPRQTSYSHLRAW